ncbi:acyl-CoA dehydrogenase family protein [Nocardioides pyridinolyticus]
MSIGISGEHVELASSLRTWAGDMRGRELVRAAEQDADATFASAWGALAEMGVPAIGLPESAGGGGGTPLDVAVALEACAHELVPGPLLGPAVAAALLGDLPEAAVVGIALDGVLWDAPSATHVLVDATGGDSCRATPSRSRPPPGST